jgi:hypothetical protein
MARYEKPGQPTKYKPELCEQLIQTAETSHLHNFSIAGFCQQIGISDRLYYTFTSKYPEFREAHQRAMTIMKARWLCEGASNLCKQHFSHWGWERQLVWRFGDNRIYFEEFSAAPTLKEKVEVIFKAIGEGSITLDQGEKLMSACERGAKLIEASELQRRIEELENAFNQSVASI